MGYWIKRIALKTGEIVTRQGFARMKITLTAQHRSWVIS